MRGFCLLAISTLESAKSMDEIVGLALPAR
jgi:hypothetical protein